MGFFSFVCIPTIQSILCIDSTIKGLTRAVASNQVVTQSSSCAIVRTICRPGDRVDTDGLYASSVEKALS
jgi:hypothetical protein